jgi:hypothetical protein
MFTYGKKIVIVEDKKKEKLIVACYNYWGWKKWGIIADGINKKRAIAIWDEQGEEHLLLGINKIAKT